MGSALGEYHRQVRGVRLSASSGSLKPYISDKSIDKDQMLDTPESDAQVIASGKALWFDDIGEYLFSSIE